MKGSELYSILSKVGSKSFWSELQGKQAIPWHSRQLGQSPRQPTGHPRALRSQAFCRDRGERPQEAAVLARNGRCLLHAPAHRQLPSPAAPLPFHSKTTPNPAGSHPVLFTTDLALLLGTGASRAKKQRRRTFKPSFWKVAVRSWLQFSPCTECSEIR